MDSSLVLQKNHNLGQRDTKWAKSYAYCPRRDCVCCLKSSLKVKMR